MDHRSSTLGCAVWFTGLSGAGKSTVAGLVRDILFHRGRPAELLDGDVIRENLSSGLGFSKADRDTNVRRIGWVCDLLVRHGIFACAAAISPYEAARQEVRKRIGHFVLVHCTAPLEILERRDVKGLYRRARSGELRHFTGIDDPYEEPVNPEVIVRSDGSETPEQSAQRVVATLVQLGYLPR